MKLQKIANTALKSMVDNYSESGRDSFGFDYFQQLFPEESKGTISDAISVLKSDGFVSILYADNVAYITSLKPNGIRNCQEDTMLKKGYSLIKEIKSLIS